MERWKQIDDQEKQERLDKDFKDNIQKAQEESTARTEMNRKKRQRQKEAKLRKKNLQLLGVATAVVASQSKTEDKKEEKEEFAYTSISVQVSNEAATPEPNSKPPAIPNDGSFLDRMKAQMSQESPNSAKSSGEATKKDPDDEDEPPKKRQATWTELYLQER